MKFVITKLTSESLSVLAKINIHKTVAMTNFWTQKKGHIVFEARAIIHRVYRFASSIHKKCYDSIMIAARRTAHDGFQAV